MKLDAIGQSIMQAICLRRLLCPLQIGLSVQLHHNFRSKYLIDVLHHLGYCSSYAEVTRFKRNAALTSGSGSFTLLIKALHSFYQQIIAAITPKIKTHPCIHRRNAGGNDIKRIATVDIREYKPSRSMLRDFSICELPVPTAIICRLADSFSRKVRSKLVKVR